MHDDMNTCRRNPGDPNPPVAARRSGLVRGARVLPVIALLCATLAVPPSASARNVEDRYNLISAFLYNFLLFTEWPDDDAAAPMVIGVLGDNPFGKAAAAIEQKKVGPRPVRMRFFKAADEVTPVHVLFVPLARDGEAEAICRAARGRAMLTVGEGEQFTRRGGMIRFFEQSDQFGAEAVLRIEINEAVAEAEGLRFRAKLLRLAQRVSHPPPGGP